jgi:hypothetical protein
MAMAYTKPQQEELNALFSQYTTTNAVELSDLEQTANSFMKSCVQHIYSMDISFAQKKVFIFKAKEASLLITSNAESSIAAIDSFLSTGI